MSKVSTLRNWIRAARLRTLPLAVAGILSGSALAAKVSDSKFDFGITGLALLTAVLLQILSNFANDYGDFKKGTDHPELRTDRALASGSITEKSMKTALVILSAFCLVSGICLLYVSFGQNLNLSFLIMLLIGLLAVASAINYTVGKKAYGYKALGDLFVFVFFGLVSVMGVYFLYHFRDLSIIDSNVISTASSMGLFCTAVLNVNNMRDIHSDKNSGKTTLPVLMGLKSAKFYHAFLILTACSLFLFVVINLNEIESIPVSLAFLLCGLFIFRMKNVLLLNEKSGREKYNKELKWLSLTILMIPLVLWL